MQLFAYCTKTQKHMQLFAYCTKTQKQHFETLVGKKHKKH
jgi:hypothetical protein